MLKLEKKRYKEVSVTVRDRQRCLNRTFLVALAIAIGMHLFAVLIFHIHSILATSDVVLPPTFVESDLTPNLDDPNMGVLAVTDPEGRHQRHTLAPIPSNPKLPSIATPSIAREMEYLQVQNSRINPFISTEEDWQYLTVNNQTQTKIPVQIHLAGQLADIPLIHNGTEFKSALSFNHDEVVIYQVQVERKTGRVFWFIPKQIATQPALNSSAEKILNELLFQADPQAFVASGEIEIRFNSQGKI